MVVAMGLVACEAVTAPPDEVEVADGPRTLDDVLADPPAYGASVLVGPLRITSPSSAGSGHVYAQDPVSGAGIQVRRGALDGWPPRMGADVTLRLAWAGTPEVPVAWLASMDNIVDEAPGGPLVVADAPEAPAAYTLARYPVVRVTSMPDPVGRADTDLGRPLRDAFGVGLPSWTSEGALTALVLEDGSLALRSGEDWAGAWADPAPIASDVATIRAGALSAGTWVSLAVTQATPWTPDHRYVVVQDEVGHGLWVDAEGFGGEVGAPGEVGTWTAEVRYDGEVPYLRSWWPAEVSGSMPVVTATVPEDGAILDLVFQALGSPDPFGERVAGDGTVLDDRFGAIDALSPPVSVRGALLVRGDAVRVAVLP
jgi:hypothetical protein